MNRDTEQSIAQQIRASLEIVEGILIHDSTADVTEPCAVTVTVTVERSSFNLKQTQVSLRSQTTVKAVEPES